VSAVDLVTGDYVHTVEDVQALMISQGFAGHFGAWRLNDDGVPVLQLITRGQMKANFAANANVLITCQPREGYPKACV
jgi:hypothetical protein